MAANPTILVVDDAPENVKLLEMIFIKEGFGVIKASDGPEARRLARLHGPDVILLDIMMPGEDGFETCTALKADPTTTDIPVIFVSALDEIDEKVKGFTVGGVDYITKPFERAEVLARTRLHIKLRQAYAAIAREQGLKLSNLREAQEAILTRPEDKPEAGFSVCYKPFHEAGGDFYDVVQINKGIFGYFVADVSGHSVGSSLSTSALKVLFTQNASALYKPEETMKTVNRVVSTVMTEGQFITACYAHLNRLRSKLTLISAGHPPVIFVSKEGRAETVAATGDVMGVFHAISFDIYERSVSKGDRFFLYTDGLVERFGEEKRSWQDGLPKLRHVCGETRDMPLDRAVDEIVMKMCENTSPPADDLVLLGVEV
jgi:phosphoserine phosphatase RsbU/P